MIPGRRRALALAGIGGCLACMLVPRGAAADVTLPASYFEVRKVGSTRIGSADDSSRCSSGLGAAGDDPVGAGGLSAGLAQVTSPGLTAP